MLENTSNDVTYKQKDRRSVNKRIILFERRVEKFECERAKGATNRLYAI